MDKIRIGVLGCGNIASRAVIPAIKSLDEFELVAIASRSLENARISAKRFDCEAIHKYENLLSRHDIEAIYISLPVGLHHKWTIKSLNNNKHVLCEKSISTDYRTAYNMVETAKQNKLVLIENFMFLYHSQHKFVLEKINSNEIGEIRCFRSSFGFPPLSKDNIRYNKSLGGGSLLDAGSYTVRTTQLFLGDDLSVKGAFLKYDEETEIDLYGGAFLTNNKGQFAELAFGFDNYYQCKYEIWGSKGKIIAERAYTPPHSLKPKIVIEKQDLRNEFHLPANNQFANILKEFHNSIKKGNSEHHFSAILNQQKLLDEIRQKC